MEEIQIGIEGELRDGDEAEVTRWLHDLGGGGDV